jgi:Flp pilus assembly pilin Flp
LRDGQVSGDPATTRMDLLSVRTAPNVPLDGAEGSRIGCLAWAGARVLVRSGGQGLVEYGLILLIAAIVCVVSLLFFGDQLSSLLSLITGAV